MHALRICCRSSRKKSEEEFMERAGAGRHELPGFRFHPTEEELLDFYLRNVVLHGRKLSFDVIGTLNIYLHDPCELPGLAKIGEREWYFFVPRDRRSGGGGRPNRTTGRGYWKATGSDRPIRCAAEPRRLLGLKKTLVFYSGRAPRGTRTDWVMSEYRLPEEFAPTAAAGPLKEDIVLCKVYRKATSLRELEQRAAKEEDDMRGQEQYVGVANNASSYSDQDFDLKDMIFNEEAHGDSEPVPSPSPSPSSSSALASPPELPIPKSGLEWMQDPFLRSPWMDAWSPFAF